MPRVITVCRKPCSLAPVSLNVKTHHAGALNIDPSRIPYLDGEVDFGKEQKQQVSTGAITGAFGAASLIGTVIPTYSRAGRWPPNIILTSTEGAEDLDEQSEYVDGASRYFRKFPVTIGNG